MPCSIQKSSLNPTSQFKQECPLISYAKIKTFFSLLKPYWCTESNTKVLLHHCLCRKELLCGTENCWGKQRPKLRTHLMPKKCLSHSTTDKAQGTALLALGRELTFLSIHSGRLSQWIRVSLAHLQVQSPLGDTSCKLEPGFALARQVLSPFRLTAPKVLPRGHWSLCNRPVRPRCLFAHHTTRKPEKDVEALRAATQQFGNHWSGL